MLDCYGITEAAGNWSRACATASRPDLSCGVPYPLTEVRIVDADDNDLPPGEVGELIARGPQIMTGYWGRPDATAETLRDGWLHTGDLARRDANGFFFIVDRTKDLILSGGYNVYPAEVEEVLQAHPSVAMCAVLGIPDDIKGEKPWAAVVPSRGAEVDVAALDDHCRAQLAAYKVPRRFLVVDERPRSSVGKILRRELRARYAPGGRRAMTQPPWSWKEMMAIFFARQIEDGDTLCSGAHTEISFCAAMLAQKSHAPQPAAPARRHGLPVQPGRARGDRRRAEDLCGLPDSAVGRGVLRPPRDVHVLRAAGGRAAVLRGPRRVRGPQRVLLRRPLFRGQHPG